MGLSDHEVIHCSSKTLLLKVNKHPQSSFRLMKNFSDEILVENLNSKLFFDYWNDTCVTIAYSTNVYQNFVTKFLSEFDVVTLSVTLFAALIVILNDVVNLESEM